MYCDDDMGRVQALEGVGGGSGEPEPSSMGHIHRVPTDARLFWVGCLAVERLSDTP